MIRHVVRTAAVVLAGESANASSGLSSAVIVAVIGVVGLILQMLVKDWIDARRSKRRRRAHLDERDVIEGLRREVARLHRELDEERRRNA